MDNTISIENNQRTPFETVESICGVPAQKSGFISLVIQFLSLILSALIVGGLFCHIGGFIQIFPNSTIIETVINSTTIAPIASNFKDIQDAEIGKILNATEQVKLNIYLKINNTSIYIG